MIISIKYVQDNCPSSPSLSLSHSLSLSDILFSPSPEYHFSFVLPSYSPYFFSHHSPPISPHIFGLSLLTISFLFYFLSLSFSLSLSSFFLFSLTLFPLFLPFFPSFSSYMYHLSLPISFFSIFFLSHFSLSSK